MRGRPATRAQPAGRRSARETDCAPPRGQVRNGETFKSQATLSNAAWLIYVGANRGARAGGLEATIAGSLALSPNRNRARSVSPTKRVKGKVDCGKSKFESRVVGGGPYFGRRGHLREAMHAAQPKHPPRTGVGMSASTASIHCEPSVEELEQMVCPWLPATLPRDTIRKRSSRDK